MAVERINSADDPRVAGYRGLRDGELVRSRGSFVAEGRLVVRRVVEDGRYRVQSLTKPFETIELMARLEALLRRRPSSAQPGGDTYRCGDISVDFRRMEVTRGGVPVDLSAREFKLLRHFIAHRGATLSRDALLADVWGYDEMPLTRTVDVHVAGLRRRSKPTPSCRSTSSPSTVSVTSSSAEEVFRKHTPQSHRDPENV